jgi:pimeloyl-ACP methyl ester carboxylesterase
LKPNEAFPAGDSRVVAREVFLGDERVRVLEAGASDAMPVLMLHGWGGSAYNFNRIMGPLADAGLRAIAPDLRGHGWSATRSGSGTWTRQAMTEWIRSLLDTLGVRQCVLVGQSIGGALALDAAAAMPDRVRGLVLLSSIGFTHVRRVMIARALGWIYPWTAPRWAVRLVLRRIYGVKGQWTERDVDEYWLPMRRRDVVSSVLQSAKEFDFAPREFSLPDECRIAIRFGELDRLISHRAAIRHATRFKNADVAVLPGVGHVPAEEVPDEIVQIIVKVAGSDKR